MPREGFDISKIIPAYQEADISHDYLWRQPHPLLHRDKRAVLGALASNLTQSEVAETADISYYLEHNLPFPEELTIRAAKKVLPTELHEKIAEPSLTTQPSEFFETVRFALEHGMIGKGSEIKQKDVAEGTRRLNGTPGFKRDLVKLGIQYTEQLKHDHDRGYTGLLRWYAFLNNMTHLSPSERIVVQRIVESKEPDDIGDEHTVLEDKGRDTWALLLGYALKDSIRSRTGQHLRNFTFGPNISDKPSETLLAVVESIEALGAAQTFGYMRYNRTMTSLACDLFVKTLREAGSLGWSNANVLEEALEAMPRRQIQPYQSIIHLSNKAVHVLNKSGTFDETKLSMLSPVDIENTPEAIRRCMYVVFELGQQAPQESQNFLLSGEICALILAEAESEFKETDYDEPNLEQQSEVYRQLRQGTSSAYWDKWRAGYGIFS